MTVIASADTLTDKNFRGQYLSLEGKPLHLHSYISIIDTLNHSVIVRD